MSKKRAKKYDKPIQLKDNVEFSDLIGVALKPQKEEQKTPAKKRY